MANAPVIFGIGLQAEVPASVVNSLAAICAAATPPVLLRLVAPDDDDQPLAAAATATSFPVGAAALHPFADAIVQEVHEHSIGLGGGIASTTSVVLDAAAADGHRCILLHAAPQDDETVHYPIAVRFDAVPAALRGLHDGTLTPWALRNVGALGDGLVAATALQQRLEDDGAASESDRWSVLAQSAPQATQPWDSVCDVHVDRAFAVFCTAAVPPERRRTFLQQCYASEEHDPDRGCFVRFVDSPDIAQLEAAPSRPDDAPPAAGADDPFRDAPLAVIDAFVKRCFPGRRLHWNRYLILDQRFVDGDGGDDGEGGPLHSCILVDNNETEFGLQAPGPKALRVDVRDAFSLAVSLGVAGLTFDGVADEAHEAMGIYRIS